MAVAWDQKKTDLHRNLKPREDAEILSTFGNVVFKIPFYSLNFTSHFTDTRIQQLSLMLVETTLNRLRLVSNIDCMLRQ